MKVDWKRFSEDLSEWESASSHDRFVRLCNAFERAIRRAYRKDVMLDFVEVTAALDHVAGEIAKMRREHEGRKPCARLAIEMEPNLAERLRACAGRAGLDPAELVAALLDRQLLSAAEPEEEEEVRGRRKRRRSRDTVE